MALDHQTASDEELARQTQAGSLAAFEELVSRYSGRLYRFARQYCQADADAQEAVQEAFVRAFQAIGQYDSRRSFAPWLFTIARRKCVDLYRAALPMADQTAPDEPDPDNPAQLLERREQRQDLWRLARRLLPDLQFQALWLRYAEDLSVADIARVLRRTRTHVKVLLFRARRTLARQLERPPQSGRVDRCGSPAQASRTPAVAGATASRDRASGEGVVPSLDARPSTLDPRPSPPRGASGKKLAADLAPC